MLEFWLMLGWSFRNRSPSVAGGLCGRRWRRVLYRKCTFL